MWGSTNRRIQAQVSPSIKKDTISRITKAKKAGRVAQVVEHQPTKCEFKFQYHKKVG
jgi:hypothetical protein